MLFGEPRGALRDEPASPEHRPVHLMPKPNPPSIGLCEGGILREPPLLGFAVWAIAPRDHPVGASLEDVEPGHLGRDLRDELDRACGIAHHCNVESGQINVMPPLRGMECDSAKVLRACKFGGEGSV